MLHQIKCRHKKNGEAKEKKKLFDRTNRRGKSQNCFMFRINAFITFGMGWWRKKTKKRQNVFMGKRVLWVAEMRQSFCDEMKTRQRKKCGREKKKMATQARKI